MACKETLHREIQKESCLGRRFKLAARLLKGSWRGRGCLLDHGELSLWPYELQGQKQPLQMMPTPAKQAEGEVACGRSRQAVVFAALATSRKQKQAAGSVAKPLRSEQEASSSGRWNTLHKGWHRWVGCGVLSRLL